MNKTSRNILSLFVLALSLLPATTWAGGSTTTFSHHTDNGQVSTFGTKKLENYNVAIKLPVKLLDGAVVEKVKVPMVTSEAVSYLKVWLTTELKTKKVEGVKGSVNDANILTQDVPVSQGVIEVKLDKPYTLSANQEVYVGYSFTLDSLTDANKTPIEVVDEVHDGGFYIFTSRKYLNWSERKAFGSLALGVELSNVKTHAVALQMDNELTTPRDSVGTTTLHLTNMGAAGVKSIDYAINIAHDGKSVSAVKGHQDLSADVPMQQIEATTDVKAALPVITKPGKYDLTLTIDKVNGQANETPDSSRQAKASYYVYSRKTKHRPAYEEYTGTWCSFCPRGIVAMEQLTKKYGDDFIGVSYHALDTMAVVIDQKDLPNDVNEYPIAWLDRMVRNDAYWGSNHEWNSMGYYKDIETFSQILAPADIDVEARLSDDESRVDAAANVIFARDFDAARYKVEFILTEDSLHGEGAGWKQENWYAGQPKQTDSDFDRFTKGTNPMPDMYYNDVVMASSFFYKNSYALPEKLVMEQTYTAPYSFTLDKVVQRYGHPSIQDKHKLTVVALLVDDNTGYVVNAAKAKVSVTTAIAHTASTAVPTPPTAIYDLTGRKLPTLRHGLNIVRTADGRCVKVMK